MPTTRPLALVLCAALAAGGCAATRDRATPDAGAGGSDDAGWPYSGVLQDGTTFRLAGRIADKVLAGEAIEYVAALASPGDSPFAEQFRAGHAAALADASLGYPMNGAIDGPDDGPGLDVDAQVAQIESRLEADAVDCLSVEPAAAEGLAAIVNRTVAAGIPVFTVGEPAGGNELAALAPDVGQEAAGAAAALVQWAKAAKIKLRTFAVSAADPDSLRAQARLRAFRNAIQDAIPKATFVTTEDDALATTTDAGQARAAYAAFLAAHPGVQLVLSADGGAPSAGRAIRDVGLEGRAFVAGWSMDAAQLDAIEAGVQVLAIDERWATQGGFGPAACAALLADGAVQPATLEPVVVSGANVAAARAELAGLLGQ